MSIVSKMATLFRGDLPLRDLPHEYFRRRRVARHRTAERQAIESINEEPARLGAGLRDLTPAEMLEHFRTRPYSFFPFSHETRSTFSQNLDQYFPGETQRLTDAANKIVNDQTWELAGFGEIKFDAKNVWRSDPFSHEDWGLDYHAEVVVYREGGPDIRVLWELNRLGHLVTLALAYQVSVDERFAETFFQHVDEWMRQNPYGRGANWNCAMEAALRAMNVLAAFDILRGSAGCNEERLARVLQFADQHGRFILDNNEFSYVGTSNHYLSDVIGLFWIGTMLPELEQAREWREFGAREMQKEALKQVLADGADFEASTGYHSFVTQMLLYSLLLGQRNDAGLTDEFTAVVRRMLDYLDGIIRTDGKVPLIGDADGSQIIPFVGRDADDRAYLLHIGASIFKDLRRSAITSPEVFWLLGEQGIKCLQPAERWGEKAGSTAFPHAHSYVMRSNDLYLHLRAGDVGANGRGSHAHNDALSFEICVGDQPFIIDPGSYVYNLDREARHQFRSTAFHSTVMVDGIEQNSTDKDLPFVMGNEARPRVLTWKAGIDRDYIEAVHYGYERLREPVIHIRRIDFDKTENTWLLTDEFKCRGEHEFSFRIHLAPGVEVKTYEITGVRAADLTQRAQLVVRPLDLDIAPVFEPAFASKGYGHKEPSTVACWRFRSRGGQYRWSIIAARNR